MSRRLTRIQLRYSRLVAASDGSTVDLMDLGQFLRQHPEYVVETLPAFFRYLDSSAIPASSHAPDDDSREAAALAATACAAVVQRCWTSLSTDAEAFGALFRMWPQILKWLDCIVGAVVLDCRFGESMQRLGLQAVLMLAKLADCRKELRTPEMAPSLIKIWAHDGVDPDFHAAVLGAQERLYAVIIQSVLGLMRARLSNQEEATWSEHIITLLATPIGGTADDIASVAVNRVQAVLRTAQTWKDRAANLADECSFLTITSICRPVQRALLQQGCVRVVVETLLLLTTQPRDSDTDLSVFVCLVNCSDFLFTVTVEKDMNDYAQEAVRAGLLLGLLQGAPWIDHYALHGTEAQHAKAKKALSTFDTILTVYLSHRAVFLEVLRAMKNSQRAISTYGDSHKSGPTLEILRKLVRAVASWEPALHTQKSFMETIRKCSDRKCVIFTQGCTFLKRCSGCLEAAYCSYECQQYDWKIGDHRQYCKSVQDRYRDGTMQSLGSRGLNDKGFLDAIRSIELAKHKESLDASIEETPVGMVPFIVVDLTVVPAIVSCYPPVSETRPPRHNGDDPVYKACLQRALALGYGIVQLARRQGKEATGNYSLLFLRRSAEGRLERRESLEQLHSRTF